MSNKVEIVIRYRGKVYKPCKCGEGNSHCAFKRRDHGEWCGDGCHVPDEIHKALMSALEGAGFMEVKE